MHRPLSEVGFRPRIANPARLRCLLEGITVSLVFSAVEFVEVYGAPVGAEALSRFVDRVLRLAKSPCGAWRSGSTPRPTGSLSIGEPSPNSCPM